ncbi:hypothetical protein BDW22DRAFT_1266678 [Trametopsis cervina]|nr:hypothetical protein BDW22DRAFT_1266678 [Trametopsis cervina]
MGFLHRKERTLRKESLFLKTGYRTAISVCSACWFLVFKLTLAPNSGIFAAMDRRNSTTLYAPLPVSVLQLQTPNSGTASAAVWWPPLDLAVVICTAGRDLCASDEYHGIAA